MLRSLKNRLDSMGAVYDYCQENPTKVNLIPGLKDAVTSLGVEVQAILSKEALQELNNKGVTVDKNTLKQNMITLGSALASAGQSYADTVGKNTLYTNLQYIPSILMRGKSSTAISVTQNVYEILKAIPLVDRTTVGLTDAVLQGLEDAISDFSADANSTGTVIGNRKFYTQDLHKMVNEGCNLMRKRLLKVAKQLAETEPEFYFVLVERSRVANSHTHTKQRFVVLNDTDQKPLAKAKVEVLQTGKSAVTNSKGECSIYLPFGDYTFEISLDKFITMQVDGKVKKGSNTKRVELSPAFVLPAETVVEKEKVTVEK